MCRCLTASSVYINHVYNEHLRCDSNTSIIIYMASTNDNHYRAILSIRPCCLNDSQLVFIVARAVLAATMIERYICHGDGIAFNRIYSSGGYGCHRPFVITDLMPAPEHVQLSDDKGRACLNVVDFIKTSVSATRSFMSNCCWRGCGASLGMFTVSCFL
jgi:hypothetical protein